MTSWRHYAVARSEAWLSLAQMVSTTSPAGWWGTFLCPESPLHPGIALLSHFSLSKNRATIMAAEESEDDGGCCIAECQCPHALHSHQLSWKDIAAHISHWDGHRTLSMGAHELWPVPFPRRAHVCAGMHPVPLSSTEPHWPPTPLPVMSHVQHDELLYRSHVLS